MLLSRLQVAPTQPTKPIALLTLVGGACSPKQQQRKGGNSESSNIAFATASRPYIDATKSCLMTAG